MYREPCASADGVGGSRQTNDEVGEEDGERPSVDEGGGHSMSHAAPMRTSRGFSGTRMRTSPMATNSAKNYAVFRDYSPQWHDRTWWDSNYTRIILVGGGWWFWDAGYWYPAWGYDPYYTYYPYDGPIYGYRDLTPDRIIINVQRELRNDGY